jgi:hypothetical protein
MKFRSFKYAIMLAFAAQSGMAFSQGMTQQEKDEVNRRQTKQTAELGKWKTEQQGIFTIHIPPTGTSKIISYKSNLQTNGKEWNEVLARLLAVGESACPGFGNSKVNKSNGSVLMYLDTEKTYCSLDMRMSTKVIEKNGEYLVTYTNPTAFVLLLNSNSDPEPSDRELSVVRVAGRLAGQMTDFIRPDGTIQPETTESGIDDSGVNAGSSTKVGSTSQSIASPTSLKAAMDAIPRANRPIGMAMREGEWDSYNMQVEYTNMVLFPGGVAIPATCRNWNPQQSPKNITGCGTSSYTLSNGQVRFPGKSDASDLTDFTGFTAGKSVSIDVGNVSGGGASTYGASISQVSGGELLMTPSGDISSGDWVSNSLSGSSFTGYAGGSTKGVTGKYYLDGFLIAVQDRNGQISIGFIGQKHESSDVYTYLNGEQFWK